MRRVSETMKRDDSDDERGSKETWKMRGELGGLIACFSVQEGRVYIQ
jgi:hypothetical protein